MYLEGQADQRGYAMAAVLVAIGVMAIAMTALLPVWRQQAQREKEAELLFRLQQYALAIDLYRNKNGGALPPNVETLVQGKYLRKRYKDPMTGDDFQPLFAGQQPTTPGPQGRGGPVGPQGRGSTPQRGSAPPAQSGQQPGRGGGIVRFLSKSKETSIRNQRGATTYDQWVVTSADAPPGPGFAVGRGIQPGMGGPQANQPGRGGPGRGNTPSAPGRGASPPAGAGRGRGQ